METTETTIHTLAGEAYQAFETATRDDDSSYVRRRDDAPEWVGELVQSAHGEFFPDDWRYEAIRDACGYIADNEPDEDDGPHEFADSHVDVYTGARLAWLASHLSRPGYVDEARDEGLIGPDAGITDAIGVGQYCELLEVYRLVWEALSDRLDELEDDSPDEN
jgi:hypothetical protein